MNFEFLPSFLALLFFLCVSNISSGEITVYDDNLDNDDTITVLADLVNTHLLQNLDSAKYYLNILEKKSPHDSESRSVFLKLALIYHFYRNDLDSSIYFTDLYFQYGQEHDDAHIATYALSKLMFSYVTSGDLEKSESYRPLLLSLLPQVTDPVHLSKVYSSLAGCDMYAGRYDSAIRYNLKIDSIYSIDETNNRSRAMALENIGSIYGNQKDTLAYEYYSKSREIYSKIDDIEGVNNVAIQLANHLHRMDEPELAIKEFLSCKDFVEDYQRYDQMVDLYQGLLGAYLAIGEVEEAELYQEKLTALKNSNKQYQNEASYYYYSGDLFYHKKDFVTALSYYVEGLKLPVVDIFMRYEGLNGIINTYEALDDYKNAYRYSQLRLELNDSINERVNYQTLQTLETDYKTKQKEEEIKLLSAQNDLNEQKQRVLSTIYISIIAVSTLLASFLYFLYRNRRKVAKQLDALDKMKSKFFTNISHEFRTPLTIIGGLSNQILKSPHLDTRHAASMQTIQGNVDRLAILTNQLIDLNKIDAQKIEANFVSGDIHAYLKKYASLFMSYVTSQEKKLIINIPEEALIMDFDEEKMQSVLYNLLQNAIKHTGDNGVIEMRASRQGNNFNLEIMDNGKGIDPAIIDKIFDRFYSTSEQGALGSGVGLAYVKELVLLCKGEIHVISELDQGSTFSILLPIVHEAKQKATLDIELPVKLTNHSVAVTSEPIATHGDMHMLIVEDNNDILTYLKSLLQDEFLVMSAQNGKVAIDIIENETIDFILSDVMMPEMNGFEFCKYVKSNSDHSHIPFILITAKTAPEDRRKGQELGVDGYLTKPFDEEELLALIFNLLRKRKDKINWFTEVLELKSSQKAEELIRQEDLDFIKQLQKLILEHPISYGVEELSKEMGMTSKTMRSKVQALTGKAINKYSNHIRIEKSKELLQNTDYTISQIAIEVGYQDAAYFSRVFKKYSNSSPKRYREQI